MIKPPPWAIGAAVAAPFVFKNDERGYFKTAAVTTPFVGAAAAVFPHLKQSTKVFSNQAPNAFSALKNPGQHPLNIFADLPRGNRKVSFDDVLTLFNSHLENGTSHLMLSHAIESARRRVLTMAELQRNPLVPNDKLPFAPEEMRKILNQYRDNPDFLASLQYGLNRTEKLQVGNPLKLAGPTPFEMIEEVALDASNPATFQRLSEFNEEYSGILKQLLERDASGKSYLRSAKATFHKETGNILGVDVTSRVGAKTESLRINFQNPELGAYYMGPNYEHLGWGRKVVFPDGKGGYGVYETDHALMKMLEDRTDFKDLSDHASKLYNFTGKSPDNAWKAANMADSNALLASTASVKLRLQEAQPAPGRFWRGVDGKLTSFAYAAPEVKDAYYRGMFNLGYSALGSESGTPYGVVQASHLQDIFTGGISEGKKQHPAWRSLSKNISLDPGSVAKHGLSPFGTTSALQNLTDGENLFASLSFAAITPQQKNLFSHLPNSVEALSNPEVEAKAVQAIASDFGVDSNAATQIYKDWTSKLTDDKLASLKRAQEMGESEFLMAAGFRDVNLRTRSVHHVDELRDVTLGEKELKTLRDLEGHEFGPGTVIGFHENSPVTAHGFKNKIQAVAPDPHGGYSVIVEETLSGRGAKWEAGGVKTLTSTFNDAKETGLFKEALNDLYSAAGQGRPIGPQVTAYGLENYVLHKMDPSTYAQSMLESSFEVASEILHPEVRNKSGLMAEAAETVDRGIETPATKVTNEFLTNLEGRGFKITVENGRVTYVDFWKGANNADRAGRASDLTQLSEGYLDRIGSLLTTTEDPALTGDFFNSYWSSAIKNKNLRLSEYTKRFGLRTLGSAWDSTLKDVPREVRPTYDLFMEMYRSGNTEGMKDIMSRQLFFTGDPQGAGAFAEHLAKRDFQNPLGAAYTAEDLAGFQMRPDDPRFKGNYSIDLGDAFQTELGSGTRPGAFGPATDVRYLPVLGRDSYGGHLNKFGPGQFQASDLERQVNRIFEISKAKTVTQKAEMAQALKQYFETLGDLYGKSGFLRAAGVDPNGVAGFLRTRTAENPFEVTISPNMLNRVRDGEVRKSLEEGQDVFAVGFRHPISGSPYLKVKVDPNLDPNTVGMSETIRSIFQSDNDKDTINLLFMKTTESIAEAKANIETMSSSQWETYRIRRLVQGYGEDAEQISGEFLREARTKKLDFVGRLKEIETAVGGNANKYFANISARSSDAIGLYSNLLTSVQFGIEANPHLQANVADRTLMEALSWNLRQVPISMRKGKTSFGDDPRRVYDLVRDSLDLNTAEQRVVPLSDRVTNLYQGLLEATGGDDGLKSLVSKSNVHEFTALGLEEHYRKILATNGGKQFETNVMTDLMNVRRDRVLPVLENFVENFDQNAFRLTELLTSTRPNLLQSEAWSKNVGKFAPYLLGNYGGFRQAEQTMADQAATSIGDLNRMLSQAGKEMRPGWAKAKPYVLAGLGAAAVIGALSGPGKSPRSEEAIGASDRVPGEGVQGSASASNPPRQLVPPPKSVKTTMVAPMHQTDDLQVQAEAENRKDAAELARKLEKSKVNSGSVHYNVNYHGSWKDASSKHRLREKIKEELER